MTKPTFVFPVRVYVEDTDYTGIIYHANYLKYMERARSQWLLEIGYDLATLAEQDCLFVLRSANLDFLRPATLNKLIDIVTEVTPNGKTCLDFVQTVRDSEQHDIIYARGTIKLVCVNNRYKPRIIPPNLMEKLCHEL